MSFRGDRDHPDELLSASLSGDLSPDEERRLSEHLSGCAACRETLAAFREQRTLLHGLHGFEAPRDLRARVSAGIDAGRFSRASWWRRRSVLVGLGGSLATVAAGIVAVVLLGNLRPPQQVAVASPTARPSAASEAPTLSASPLASLAASAAPTPIIEVQPGEWAAIVARGGTPDQPNRSWEFRDLSSSQSIRVESAGGVPISAELSPNGELLAYVTSLGETGAQEVRVLDLADGTTTHLGCSASWPFTDRLTWSTDGTLLAYTLAGVDLGSISDCTVANQPIGQSDAWVFNAFTGIHARLTTTGDAYAAAFRPYNDLEGGAQLIVSHAAATPWSEELRAPPPLDPGNGPRVDDVFMPRLSADGRAAIFWRGTMDGGSDGWSFVSGGMPYLSGVPADGPAAWAMSPDGNPLFRDLQLTGPSDGFASGNVAWSADGRYVAVWNGQWIGTPQSADGTYPDGTAAYVGLAADGLTSASRVEVGDATTYVEDVKFDGAGQAVLVMVAATTPGIGVAPSATIYSVPLDGSGPPAPVEVATGSPTPWMGPIVVASGGSSPSAAPQASSSP
jgi:Putative zinc-finger